MVGKYLLISAYLGFATSSLNVTSGPSADGGKLNIPCFVIFQKLIVTLLDTACIRYITTVIVIVRQVLLKHSFNYYDHLS